MSAAALIVYSNSFSNPFVLDDRDAIVTNQTIRTLSWQALWGPNQSSTAGRPIPNLSLALNYAAGGLDPAGYHAFNLAIHILCGLLLFGIIRRTVNLSNLSNPSNPSNLSSLSNLFAFLCSLIWLVHPLQSEVVDYVTQRTESLMALGFLTTLYAVIRSTQTPSPTRWHLVAIIACLLGMLCKESMAVAPLLVLLYDAVFCAGGLLAALKQRRVLYVGLASSYVVLAAIVMSGARSHSAGFSSGVSAWTYLLNQAPMIVRYLRLALLPNMLVLDYGLPRAVTIGSVLPAGLFVLALLAVVAALWRIDRRLAFLGTWFFVTLAPTSSVIPIATEVGAERRMYLPLAAVVVLAVAAAHRLLKRREWLATGVVAIGAILGVLTMERNAEYREPLTLWQLTVARYSSGRAHYNLGLQLKDAGQRNEAIREYQVAADDLPDAEYALGFEAMSDGRYDEAIRRMRRYLQRDPFDINAIRASNLLGQALFKSKRYDEAIAAYRDTLRMHANDEDATAGIGESQLGLGRYAEAAETLTGFLQRSPKNAPGYFNLGLAYMNLHRFDAAAAALSTSVALDPTIAAAHGNLATALAQLGRRDEAVAHFREAAALETDAGAKEEIRGFIEQLEAQKKGAGQR